MRSTSGCGKSNLGNSALNISLFYTTHEVCRFHDAVRRLRTLRFMSFDQLINGSSVISSVTGKSSATISWLTSCRLYRKSLCYLDSAPYRLFRSHSPLPLRSHGGFLNTTLRTPWSWQKYCVNHFARTCCSLGIVTRCRFTNWPIRCERGSKKRAFS